MGELGIDKEKISKKFLESKKYNSLRITQQLIIVFINV